MILAAFSVVEKDHVPGAKIGGGGRRHDHATPLNPEAFERIQALRRRIAAAHL